MLLLIDNYDSFTYNLYDYLLQLGQECKVVRNDELDVDEVVKLKPQGIIFSPGPKRPADAGVMMDIIHQYHQKIPLLGICLGHQALGEYFGARLVKAHRPMHGKTSAVGHGGHALFNEIPDPFQVMRYHSLILEIPSTSKLEILATTEAGEVMAVAHKKLPIAGFQFHPESILTDHGLKMLENWLKWVK